MLGSSQGEGFSVAKRLIFDIRGQPAFFQQDQYVYHFKGGACEYWVSNGWLYKVNGGGAAFYIQGNWLYTPQGKP